MIIYFADRRMNILGQASTDLPDGMIIKDDVKTEEIEAGVAVFECTLFCKDRALSEAAAMPGNYLLRQYNGTQEFYTIIDSDGDSKAGETYIYAEDAGLDLLNETVQDFEADAAHPIAWYINRFAYDSGFEIGLNEISTRSRKLSWEGTTTAAERLISVCTQFDAEISFSFDIDGLMVRHKYINIHAKRGKSAGLELREGRDFDGIRIKRSIANLATSLRPTGGIPEGKEDPITLSGYSYDDGDIYISGDRLNSRSAVAKWSRLLMTQPTAQGSHIVRDFQYETTRQQTLCSKSVAELKKRMEMEVSYELDLLTTPESLDIGDTVNVIDKGGMLYLTARVLKREESASNRTIGITLGNAKENAAAMAEEIRKASGSSGQPFRIGALTNTEIESLLT